nr:cell division protein [Bifidobacterium biavatii]
MDPSVYQQAGQSYAQDAQSTGASSSNAISDANGANGDAGQADGQTDANGANRPAFLMDSLPDLREQSGDGSTDGDTDGANPRDEFTTVYDILDQMESMLEEAKTSFFAPGVVKVDRDEFVGHLDDLKKMLPVQLERASALMREAERRLESAQTQANAIIASAQSRAADMVKDANDQAQFLAGQENVTELARQKARAILDQAQAKADRLTQGADKYCTTVMEGLQQQLGKLDRDVQAGLNVLYERQRTAGEQLPHLNNNDYPES